MVWLKLAAVISAATLLLGMLMGFDLLIPGLCLAACGVQACALFAKRLLLEGARLVKVLAAVLRRKFFDAILSPRLQEAARLASLLLPPPRPPRAPAPATDFF